MQLRFSASFSLLTSFLVGVLGLIACSCCVLMGAETAETVETQVPLEMRSPKHRNIFVVAHRGAHDGVPENTLAAYRRAIELDCDFVEIDVRTTRDGVLVSVHDATIDAYTHDGTQGAVADMTIAELKRIDIGSKVDPKWSEERIPTVMEVLRLCKGKIGVYLDVKKASIESLASIVKEHGSESDTLWYIPAAKISELKKHSSAAWPMPDPGPETNLELLLTMHRPPVVASVWRFCSKEFVETCHRSKSIVIVDDKGPETWEQLIEWKVDGIQTDSPAKLIERLRTR